MQDIYHQPYDENPVNSEPVTEGDPRAFCFLEGLQRASIVSSRLYSYGLVEGRPYT